MTKTNNPLFSNSYHVVYDRVQKKCNINQKEFFSGKFFVDKQSSGFYSYDQPEGARITPCGNIRPIVKSCLPVL